MGATLVRSPGEPASPNELLKYDPSTVMLLRRSSAPPKRMPPLDCGVKRTNESRRLLIVGSVMIASRLTAVEAPVRAELKIGLTSADTVTTSSTATVISLSTRSVATPRLMNTSLVAAGWNPLSEAVTVYGPPTRIAGTENRPSPRVTASYVVPEGSCRATTLAPGTARPCASLTMPSRVPVVTPCAWTGTAGDDSATNASTASALHTNHDLMLSLRVIEITPTFRTPGPDI